MECQKATGFLKNAYYQGHGRYVNQLMRCTIKFCKNNGSSREARKFIETRLVDVAREAPGVAIYVKPRLFKGPVLDTEYLNGEKHSLTLRKMDVEQIESWMRWYLTRSGYQLYKLNRTVATYRPSIQGIWNPTYFRDPKINMVEFPSEEYGRYINKLPTATEQLIEIAKKFGFQAPKDSSQEVEDQEHEDEKQRMSKKE